MRKLEEAFRDPESYVERVIMFIDMTDSTDMKMTTLEAEWLTTYGWFFDTIRDVVEAKGGTVVKYLGDGVIATFTSDLAADAINAAIEIQEAAAKANVNKRVRCHCTVGVASGQVVEFETPKGNTDYIGTVVDKAARLCAAASPKAVFVDTDTVSAAAMNKVISTLGAACMPRRSVRQYLGNPQLLSPKGFSSPIEYHEILWSEQPHGLKSSVVTAEVEAAAKSPAPIPSEGPTNEHRTGVVKTWDNVRSMGFIKSNDEDFYFNKSYMIYPEGPPVGAKVFFVSRDALSAGKNRVAACVCVLGEELKGRIVKIGPRDFGFVQVSDGQANTQDLYMYIGNNPDNLSLGDDVIFIVGENDKGARADRPRLAPIK